MKAIPLSQGKVALVDDADFDAVSQFKWHAVKDGRNFYALRHFYKPDGTRTTQYLHRFLMPGVSRIDHEDGNGLNNQRYNLRPATHQQNCWGFRHKKIGTTSIYRGVYWRKDLEKWQAAIRIGKKRIHIGYFTDEKDAALAWDTAARKYRGEFAHLNFP